VVGYPRFDVARSVGLESLHTESARSEAGIGGVGRVGDGRVRLTLETSIAFADVGRANVGCSRL
jgi:hypothetical protein